LWKKIIEIAAFSAACIFNQGYSPVLKILEVMGCVIGQEAVKHVERVDSERITKAERRASLTSKASRIKLRNARLQQKKVNGSLPT